MNKKWLKIQLAWRGGGGDEEDGRRNRNPDSASEWRKVGRVGGSGCWSLEQERPLEWSDPTALPWQQYGRALLLFQATWGPEHVCKCESMAMCVCVCVCVCASECEHDCIKSNTGFHVGNNKVRGFTQLCWGLEIHRGSTFSSRRKVYAFSSEECQQPWSCLQRVKGGSSWGMHKPEGSRVLQMEPRVQKNRQSVLRERQLKRDGGV